MCFEPVTVCAAPTNSNCIKYVFDNYATIVPDNHPSCKEIGKTFEKYHSDKKFYDIFLQNSHFSEPFMRFFGDHPVSFFGKLSTEVITHPVRSLVIKIFSRS